MSDQNTENNAESDSKDVSSPDPATDTGKPSEAVTEPSSPDPEVFPAAYVKELREEAAKSRVGAKKSESLSRALVTAYAEQTGRLADASDLPVTDDLMDEDGMPDREKIVAAVDELLTRKPHLSSTRVSGDVGQGARGDAVEMVSLAELLRTGAG